MTSKRWFYNGDINIEHGGIYYQESGSSDHVYAVEVIGAENMGGADNEFLIVSGSVFIGDDTAKHAVMLEHIGETLESATRHDLILAAITFHGIDQDAVNGATHVRIGKVDTYQRNKWDDSKIDIFLRGNSSLRRYVRREHLGLSA